MRIINSEVQEVFDSYPAKVKKRLFLLRQLIFDVSRDTEEIGSIEETLKWGEPSYLTSETKSGTTIRIAWESSRKDEYAMHFNCRTTLIETFKSLYPQSFAFEGNRSLIFHVEDSIPKKELRDCIRLALTYHLGNG